MRPAAHGTHWTQREDARLREEVASKMTSSEAAAAHGRSQKAVTDRARMLGCPFPKAGGAPGEQYTPELVAKLRDMWAAGYATSAIGRLLGLTKNQVIGKAHRLGLEPRFSPIRRVDPLRCQARPENEVALEAPKPGKGDPSRLARVPRTNHDPCQWIEGEPSADDKCKCGAPAVEGRPYCPEHEARASAGRWRAEEAA